MKQILLSILTFSAFSLSAQTIVYVDADATGNEDGTSWADAYTDLIPALGTSGTNIEIWVAEGTYKPEQVVMGGDVRDVSFRMNSDTVAIYGGFIGTETMLSQRDWVNNETILSGNIQDINSEFDNSRTVLRIAGSNSMNPVKKAIVDGVTIREGFADQATYLDPAGDGAGIFIGGFVEDAKIRNCTITQNGAHMGAGMAIYAAWSDMDVQVENTIFDNNIANYAAGAFDAVAYAGYTLNIDIVQCLFKDHFANDVYGNTGRFLTNYNGSTLNGNMLNCTVVENISGMQTNPRTIMVGQLMDPGTSGDNFLNIDNCVFWGNSSSISIDNGGLNQPDEVNISNSILEVSHASLPFVTETNVLTSNPMFVDAAADDFKLQEGSPGIDAGVSSGFAALLPSFDINGNQRLMGTDIDMGCYEFDPAFAGLNIISSADVQVYPNPTASFITFSSDFEIENIRIMNLSGKEMMRTTQSVISVQEFPQGVYLIEISTESGVTTKRFVKE